jgi:hypothetical protein
MPTAICQRCRMELPDVDWYCVQCWIESSTVKEDNMDHKDHTEKCDSIEVQDK